MGQEIHEIHFSEAAFAEFDRRLRAETELLLSWENEGRLRDVPFRLGFELEGWLVDEQGMPAARNQEFLERVGDPEVVPELARFNFEINDAPLDFSPGMFDRMHVSLMRRWERCEAAAAELDMRALSIGILPTVGREHLHLGNISGMSRYHALNEQVFQLRHGQPIELHIEGEDSLHHLHDDVMLESATTSLQIHLQVGSEYAVRAFNTAKIVSAAMVAVGANSPFFMQHRLWEETRIPIFEQAVAVGASDYSRRVTFGIRYAERSITECFTANLERYPVLLPDLMDAPAGALAHLRLHNGTIWRWNRPLVGFDEAGEPHYRIEHRVVAAGTSALDIVANAALFVGLMLRLMRDPEPVEQRLPFEVARANFYAAARYGIRAPVRWFSGPAGELGQLLREELLPLAAEGLRGIGLEAEEVAHWLGIIRQRIASGQTGSAWQRAWVERHGPDWPGLVDAYAERQSLGRPVHEWLI
jgi:gamma-glutamyl:cysteine ligase YbdK (ATP-grasp superfamily)